MFATIRKELLLLMRDPGGLLLLLIMPAALIVVMALVQDAPYRDYQEMKFEILVANKDKGQVGNMVIQGLKKNKSFVVIDSVNHLEVTEEVLRNQLKEGKYKMGIIIPESTSTAIVNTSNSLANQMAESMGVPATMPVAARTDSATINLVFDPIVKPSFRSALNFALNEYITQTKIQILLDRMSKMNGNSQSPKVDMTVMNVLEVKEQNLDKSRISASMNSVQHNVPAWAIFGMFLIVVPISGNMIRERDEGSAVRIQLIPNAYRRVALGKILFYMMVCMLQFFCMVLVGIFLLPLFGLPKLTLGGHAAVLLPMSFAISFAAVNYGYFIGSIFRTANQAMPFGAISVVLFSAMGGVWVPIEILPEAMRKIAMVSPLHWSLEGVNEIMLRGRGLEGILIPFLILMVSGFVLSFLSVFFSRK